VEGYLRVDTWDDKTTGEKRSKIRVQADRVQFLESRRGDPSDAGFGGPDEATGAPPPMREREQAPRRAGGGTGGGFGEPRGPSNGAGPGRSAYPSGNVSRGRPAEPEDRDDEDIPF
jgi:single-strand DNA-binding protein